MPAAITRLRRLQQQLAAIPTAAVQETAIVPNAPRPVREDAELSADEIAQFMERGFVALPGIMPDDLRLATCDAVDQLQGGVSCAMFRLYYSSFALSLTHPPFSL